MRFKLLGLVVFHTVMLGGTLTGTFATPSGAQNLTTLGTSDWAHWGINSSASFDHKASGGSQIANFTVVNGDISQVANFGGSPITYQWGDGTPTGSAATTTGVYISGPTHGFQITAPADTTSRTLTVYLGVYATQGKITAHLSDASAPDYSDSSLSSGGSVPGSYTFNYQAGSSGKTLTVAFTNIGSGGNVNLQAATLTSGPVVPPTPDFTISATPGSQAITVGNSTTYTVTTTALNGFNNSITLSATGLPSGATAGFVPPSITGSGSSTLTITTASSTPTGSPSITVTGTNAPLVHSTSVTLNVNSAAVGGATLTGTFTVPSGAQNLTTLGTADWAHWGISSSSGFDHKASGGSQIATFTVVNGDISQVATFSGSPITYQWSDGTPTGSAATTTGVYISGPTHGFQITAPADTIPRTLTIYLGVYATQSKITAHLSDASAPDYSDSSLSSGGSVPGSYTFNYQAGSSGKTLTVAFTNIGSGGNVNLQAATLTSGPVVPPTPDFTISATPGSQAVTVGNSTTYTVTTTALNGFNNSITLSATGLPSGATAGFVPPSITGSGSSTLTITTASSTPTGSPSITVTGTNAPLVHSTSVTLNVNPVPVPDFSISASPSSQTVTVGSSTTYTVTTTALNGYNNSITLTATGLPAGATAGFVPPSITGSGSSTLTITTASGTPTGSPSITITGTSSSRVHSTSVTLNVNPMGPTGGVLSGTFATPSGTQNLTTLGTTDWAHWGLTGTDIDHKSSGGSSITNFAVVNGEAGLAAGFSENPFSYEWSDGTPDVAATTATGVYVNGAGRGFQISAPADTSVRILTVYVGAYATQMNFVAHLSDLSASDFVDNSFSSGGSSQRSYTLRYQAASVGQTITVTLTNAGSGGNVNLQAAYLAQLNFTLSASPASLTVTAGNNASYTITAAPLNGFTGSIALSAAGVPPGATASFVPPSISGGSGTSTMTIATTGPTPGGSYPLTITGKSPGLSHSAGATVNVNGIPQPDFTVSVQPGSQTVTAGTGTSYTISTAALNGFSGSIALSATGLPAGAMANFTPSTISGAGSSNMTVTTTSATPSNGYTVTVTGTSSSLTRSGQGSLIVYPAAGTHQPSLSGSWFQPTGVQNLTTLGTSDWAHWGLTSNTSFDYKATGGGQISNFSVIGATTDSVIQHDDYPVPLSWSDGTPTATSGPTQTGVYIRGINLGFSVSVPADTTQRLFVLYLGLFNAGSHLVAHISDSSSPDYVLDWNSIGSPARAYTFVYSAASAGQTLTVTFTQTAINNPNNNITIEGAALSTVGSASDFQISATPPLQSIAPGGSVTYNFAASPLAGFGGIVGFSAAGLPSNVTASFNPPALIGSGNVVLTLASTTSAPLGNYSFSVMAASQSTSHAVPLGLNLLGGTSPYLGGASFNPTGTINLTTQGTADWAYWGLNFSTSFDHKNSVVPQIQNYTVVNGQPGQVAESTGTLAYAWSDGTPDASSPGSTGYVVITGLGLGFQVVAPADTNQRTLVFYAGLFNTTGKLVAHLSDGSAPDFVDTTFSNSATVPAGYVLTYKAAVPGQTITIQWTMNDNTGPRCSEISGVHCLVGLSAVTLTTP